MNDTVVDQYKKGSNKLLVEIFADHPGQSGGGADAGGKGNILILIRYLNFKFNRYEKIVYTLNVLHTHDYLSIRTTGHRYNK